MSSWPDGTRPYLDPVYAGNQALKKGWAIYGDQPPRFDEATYYLRYAKNGKRVYKRLGSGAQQALVAKKRLEFRLRAAADGIELPPDESTGEPDSPFTTGRPLLDCITSYLKEIAVHKSKKTLAAYLPTVHGFDEFFGNLHHLNCEEEPERPDYPSAKDFPKFREQYGPRGVLHCWATDKDDATERPRWGRVGKQKIEDTTGSDLLMTAPQVQPNVVIVDLGLPLLNGMDASRELKRRLPRTKILIVTVNEDSVIAGEALHGWASGYLLKKGAGIELIQALRDILRGKPYVTPLIARKLNEDFIGDPRQHGHKLLTPRQRQVLQLLA